MSYALAAQVATSTQWMSRITMAVVNAAVDILAEPEDSPNHDARVRLAKAVMRGEPMVMSTWPRLVLANETVRAAAVASAETFGDAVTDSDLEFTIASLWTNVARSLNV